MRTKILDALDMHESDEAASGGRWRSAQFAAYDHIKAAAEGNACAFVWPDEGTFDTKGVFTFNNDHCEFQPLIIDRVSAAMFVAVFDALQQEENRAKFVRMIAQGRGHFGAVWEFVHKHVAITGFTHHG